MSCQQANSNSTRSDNSGSTWGDRAGEEYEDAARRPAEAQHAAEQERTAEAGTRTRKHTDGDGLPTQT